jgi:hypothetical protein
MPISCNTRDYDAPKLQEAIKTAQKTPITKAEDVTTPYSFDTDTGKGGFVSTITDVANTIGNVLPPIKTIASLVGSLFG